VNEEINILSSQQSQKRQTPKTTPQPQTGVPPPPPSGGGPPPPPGGGSPPPPSMEGFTPPPVTGGRRDLLSSIEGFSSKKLKKTKTVDKTKLDYQSETTQNEGTQSGGGGSKTSGGGGLGGGDNIALLAMQQLKNLKKTKNNN